MTEIEKIIGNGAAKIKPEEVVSSLKEQSFGILVTSNSWTSLSSALNVDSAKKATLLLQMNIGMKNINAVLEELIDDWAIRNGENAGMQQFCGILREEKLVAFAETLERKYFGQIQTSSSSPINYNSDEWKAKQRAHIQKNITELIKITTLNAETLAHLLASDTIGQSDIIHLNTLIDVYAKNMEFYNRTIISKMYGFENLIKAMAATKQSGVVDLLRKVYES